MVEDVASRSPLVRNHHAGIRRVWDQRVGIVLFLFLFLRDAPLIREPGHRGREQRWVDGVFQFSANVKGPRSFGSYSPIKRETKGGSTTEYIYVYGMDKNVNDQREECKIWKR